MKKITTTFIFLLISACGSDSRNEQEQYRTSNLFLPYEHNIIQSAPEAVAIGDVNNDGKNDVVVTTWDGYSSKSDDYSLLVYHQNNEGISGLPVKYATEVIWEANANYASKISSIAIGDVNNDGKNDVVVGHSGDSIEIFVQESNATLKSYKNIQTEYSMRVEVGDFNNDSRPDLIGLGGFGAQIFAQDESGDFTGGDFIPIDGYFGELEAVDLNNDAFKDIAVLSVQGLYPNLSVMFQTESGLSPPRYYSVGSGLLTNGMATGDINGDGLKDIAVVFGYNVPEANIGIFFQNHNNEFDPHISHGTERDPECINIADLNLDGEEDIVLLHGGPDESIVETFLNNNKGTDFIKGKYYLGGIQHPNPEALATGDLNNDGRPDLAIVTDNGLSILYQRP